MGFDVDRASFGDAGAVSDEIAFRMEREIKSLGLQNVEVIKGWDIVKQKMIAFGEKGRKVSNKLVVRVYDCPLEKLHRVIADAMDKCLAVDKSVIIEEISVILKDEVENEKKQEASIRAVAAMDKNASRVAETLGKKISAPKRIFFSNDKQALQSRNDFMGYGEDCRSKQNYAVEAELSRSVVSIQKSFKVKSEIVDHIKIKSRVSGIYEIE
jgi:hypothetical protein